MTTAYPPGISPHYVSYVGNIQAKQVFPNLVAATETSVAGSVQGTASVRYSGQGPLPAYQEK